MPPDERPNDRRWRCFVAVPIGEELRTIVAAAVAELRAAPEADAWRWADPQGWHVTLAFMGATDPASVPRLSQALASLAASEAGFTRDGGGLGAFPSRARARVMWYGIADPDGRLRRLAAEVQAAVGLPSDARFRGHLTLGRARDRVGTDASALLDGVEAAPSSRLNVDRLVLYRSHLGRGPARYEALSSAPLGGAS
jgi:2'-5' RNA ligase